MDENLIVYALQWTRSSEFKNRYVTYPNREERDEAYRFLMVGQEAASQDQVKPVEMTIRVETDHELIAEVTQ